MQEMLDGTEEFSDHFSCNRWVVSFSYCNDWTEFVYLLLEVAILFSRFRITEAQYPFIEIREI